MRAKVEKHNKTQWTFYICSVVRDTLPSKDNPHIYTLSPVRLILSRMQFSEKDIQEYQRIWKEEFHEEISLEDARHSASMLMELFALLMQPLPRPTPRTSESSPPTL